MLYRLALFLCLLPLADLTADEVPFAAPEFTLTTQTGEKVNLSDFRGKIVYLDFWASWCGSCRRTIPWMNSLQKKFTKDKFQVIAINLDTDSAAAGEFIKEFDPAILIPLDLQGTVPAKYKVAAMPSSFLISGTGSVVYSQIGEPSPESRASIEQQIQQLISNGEAK
jgi:thiol-disulfide isomerase/thioredoxin